MITTVSDNERAQAATIEQLRQEITAWGITVVNLEAKLAESEKCLQDSIDCNLNKLLAMTDEQVTALTRLEGSNPEEVAALARKTMELAVANVKLAEKTESEKKWIALHGAVCDLHDKAKLAALDAQEKLAALEAMYLNLLSDATQWQLYKARKDAVIAAGMGKKAMRDSAAGAAPVQQEPDDQIQGLGEDESAFIRWAEKEKYDLSCHPMFFVMLNEKTYAARMGWKAAKAYYGKEAQVQQVFGGRVDQSYVSEPMEEAPKEQTK